MSKVTLYKPKIVPPKVLNEYEEFNLAEVFSSDYEDVYGKTVAKNQYEYEKIGSGNIDISLLTDVKLMSCETDLTCFTDVVFENCDFSNSVFSRSSFHRCLFKNCKLTGVTFNESLVSNTTFIDCVGQLTAFNECKFRQVIFEKNELINLSFFECLIKDFQFFHNDMSKLEIVGTSFKGVDFSSSKIEGGRFGLESLKGAKISSMQALMIVGMLGVEVE